MLPSRTDNASTIFLGGEEGEAFTLPYLTSGMARLLHLPSAEAVLVRPNTHP